MPGRITINKVSAKDRRELIAANLANIALHEPWVYPCRDDIAFGLSGPLRR